MTMGVIVRPAREGDLAAFERLYLGLLEFDRPHHPQGRLPEFDAIRAARLTNARLQLEGHDRHALLVAQASGDGVVGYAILRLTDPRAASTDGTALTGVVYELFVDETARGSGAGSALMDAAEQWFRERGATRVKIESFAWNHAAITFYERRGYAITDVILTRWLEIANNSP
jgi:GNAT superfamily N-acetyltransferase